MKTPRWFVIACYLLLLNLTVVVTVGIWRHASADEPTALSELPGSDALPQAGSSPGGDPRLSAPIVESARTDNQPINPLDQIPLPDAATELPPPPDPESLKNDPGFQEFRRLFTQEEESWDPAPTGLPPRPGVQSDDYFEALDQRLETVEQLCGVARRIANEAARHARNGSQQQSEDLINMSTQLRDMAAKLLVTEM